jgi:predicted metalloprotease with PDZ domain
MTTTEPLITYTVAMPQPNTHLYHVTMTIAGLTPAGADDTSVELLLPTWTPGSYLIREYARHVQEFVASTPDAAPLPWHKVAKATWRVETGDAERIIVRYKVYAHDLTVRTNHLDASHGYFNGPGMFLYLPGRTSEPLRLTVQTPPGWGWRVTTGLDPAPAPDPAPDSTSFQASDYDELIDCPVECGTHRLLTFDVDGIEHRIAIWGRGNEDEQRIVADTQRIVEVQRDLFGGLPFKHYTFILHLAERYGGLEHRNSASNMVDRWSFQSRHAYERFLELQSHEFFHVWNVKRIRPAALGPFDYARENYTRLLWSVEGVTSYYDRLLLVRAGLLSPQRYLERLAEEIASVQRQPGRLLHSLEQSSFDAWIKLYRPDEHTINSTISYYLKGGLVILLLDLEIRQRSGGALSFDDVLRYLHQEYPPEAPGIPEGDAYLAAVEAVAGSAGGVYRDFFARYIAGTAELDYARGLGYVGLHMQWGYSAASRSQTGGPPAWLGLNLRSEHGRLYVGSVRSDGPAHDAAVYPGDELLALDGFRVDEERIAARVRERAPGDTVTLALFRRDELLHVPVTLAAALPDELHLRRVAAPSIAQERLFREWLPRQRGA